MLKDGFAKEFPIGFCRELIDGEAGGQETSTTIYLLRRLREKF